MTRQSWLYAAIILVLLTQAAAPGAFAAFTGKSIDPASLICAPSGKVSDEAIAAYDRMLSILGIEKEPPLADGKHCPLCVSTKAAPPPPHIRAQTPRYIAENRSLPLASAGFLPLLAVALPVQRGPPVLS